MVPELSGTGATEKPAALSGTVKVSPLCVTRTSSPKPNINPRVMKKVFPDDSPIAVTDQMTSSLIALVILSAAIARIPWVVGAGGEGQR
jgi:hypothetical protein